MKRLKFVLAGLLFTSPAFAQDATTPTEGEATAGGGAEAGAEVSTGEGGAAVDASAAVDGGMAMSTKSAIDWKLNMPAGKIGVYGGYSILRFSFDDGMGNSISGTGDALGIGGGYGVTDKITAGVQYAITPGLFDADNDFKGPLDIFGEFEITTNDKLHVVASADFSLDLCGGRDPMTGDCSTTKGLHAGLGLRYKLAPKMALFTGAPYGPGPVGQHLSVSLEDSGPITFDLPVGFMFQATPELNINAQTSLGRIALSNAGDSAFIGADFFALSVGGLFAVNDKVAVEASLSLPDLKEIGFDVLIFSVGARARL
jgi:hypothetical protein